MVLPLNGFGSANLILICGWFLLFTSGAHIGIVAGIVTVYTGIEENSVDGPTHCSVIFVFFLLSYRNLINIKKRISARYFLKKKTITEKKSLPKKKNYFIAKTRLLSLL